MHDLRKRHAKNNLSGLPAQFLLLNKRDFLFWVIQLRDLPQITGGMHIPNSQLIDSKNHNKCKYNL